MPCYDGGQSGSNASFYRLEQEIQKRKRTEAMLCGVMKVLKTKGIDKEIIDEFDLCGAGISKFTLIEWIKGHNAADEIKPKTKKTIEMPPPIHPNQIHAMYMEYHNRGQFYIGQIGGPPIGLDEWKARELKRWEEINNEGES